MLVIFDCDGVLVDSEPLSNTVFARALNREGLDWSIEETMRRLVGRSLKSCVEIIEGLLSRQLPEDFVHRLQAETLSTNTAMIQAASRAGFTREGTLRRAAWVDGEFADEVILGRLAAEWKAG